MHLIYYQSNDDNDLNIIFQYGLLSSFDECNNDINSIINFNKSNNILLVFLLLSLLLSCNKILFIIL